MSTTDFGNADFVFTDNELTELLGVIEQKAAGDGGELDVLDFFQSDANQPLALQFQPRDEPTTCTTVKQEEPAGHSAFSSALASPCEAASLQAAVLEPAPPQPAPSIATQLPVLPMPLASAAVLGAFALPNMLPAQPHTAASMPLPSLPMASVGMSLTRMHSAAAATGAAGAKGQAADFKGHISHSTVEKQRRDRINSLIDELRELVPPQQPRNGQAAGSEGLEARRPKHVVLADTITLLRQLQQKLHISGTEQIATSGLPARPADDNSEGAHSKGSASQDDMEVAGAPQMPFIPCQLTQNAGVTVERGPDCYYVQVKCRDRKGLLFDIIRALKLLPLEIRTAAVTTTGDGTVRDVFEVKLDDASLSPEEVQNLVHDALFQQFNPAAAAAAAAAMTSAYADVIALAAKRQRA